MVGFLELLASKRRFLIVGLLVAADLFLFSSLSNSAQSHQAKLSAQSSKAQTVNLTSSDPVYDSSDNAVTSAFMAMAGDASQAGSTISRELAGFTASISSGFKHGGSAAVNGPRVAAKGTARGVDKGFGSVIHGIGGGFAFVGSGIGHGILAVGHGIGFGFSSVGHGVGHVFGFVGRVSHVSSVIRPKDDTAIPTITQMRIAQASIIQSGTKAVAVAAPPNRATTAVFHPLPGSGGACDAGDGNGGYPMQWCNAPMDSVQTISFSGDPINRECTSYAYWFFTNIEGHKDFHVTGDAKYWAYNSNYPVHSGPAVGAIGVESAGYYGHVVIVQALPGQTFAGYKVPAGYALVSEMNYDWAGHFRYSYAPLSHFSAYIYP